MFNKIKDLKNLRDQANQMKTMLAEETVNAEAIHGKVNIVMDGNQEVLSVEIDPELLTPDKKEELEKGIKDATNDAVKKAQRVMAQKMQSMGGLNIPGM
ncbi:MAG: YbaB/EbfC family nucleoid-associated protein [Candidatus Kerfeldbacteria bacterium]|jgi:nucleoid-associated protein EbfC